MSLLQVVRFLGRLLVQAFLVSAGAVGILVLFLGGSAYVAAREVERLGLRRDVAPGVTAAGLQRVRAGMSVEEVTRALGRPYEVGVEMSRGHNLDCPGPLTAESARVDSATGLAAVLDGLRADTLRYCCPAYRHNRQDNIYFKLEYSRPVPTAGEYPMVSVSLDDCGQVYSVDVGHYRHNVAFWDEDYLPVYAYSRLADGKEQRFVVAETLRRLLGK
ncbi:hypothetical protein LJ737_11250 [Hymenobacter sp. 15J16-1T3B]|uniref:hypothetical protein n=1 Tax=Hymenobacter sp. 15J16-1T3B TaxID=2886941 RepID=UPI001D0FA0EF|nr:hypothetical protein [Hymenobacter sp. 15J16-1T3B]MCC3157815.1 hypothetical protein [Hymenobacter sp. 15J16-1T3B]